MNGLTKTSIQNLSLILVLGAGLGFGVYQFSSSTKFREREALSSSLALGVSETVDLDVKLTFTKWVARKFNVSLDQALTWVENSERSREPQAIEGRDSYRRALKEILASD